jgi:hypothetical protein
MVVPYDLMQPSEWPGSKAPRPCYRHADTGRGENAPAGQECPAYRIFEIAAFIPARPAFSGMGHLQHFRKPYDLRIVFTNEKDERE